MRIPADTTVSACRQSLQRHQRRLDPFHKRFVLDLIDMLDTIQAMIEIDQQVAATTKAQRIDPSNGIRKPKGGVGLQLIVFQEQEKNDFKTVAQIAEQTGYDYLEATLNILGTHPDPNHLTDPHIGSRPPILAVHVGYPNVATDEVLDALLVVLKGLGAHFLICSGQEALTIDPLLSCISTAKRFNHIGERCAALQLKFLVHTFDWIFLPCGGYIPIDELLRRTDPALVDFNLDLYWAAVARQNLRATIEKLKARCNYFHFKDGPSLTPPMFSPLGEGVINLAECLEAISHTHGSD